MYALWWRSGGAALHKFDRKGHGGFLWRLSRHQIEQQGYRNLA
jgi:hypothetical protein